MAIPWHNDEDGIRETARRVEAAGRLASVIRTDVGDPACVAETFVTVERELGSLDVLVNKPVRPTSRSGHERHQGRRDEGILRVNLMAPVFCAHAFIRMRRAQGSAAGS